MKKETEEERKKRIEQIGNIFILMMMNRSYCSHGELQLPTDAFCVLHRICTMFVLAVDEINDFKGCPFPEYFDESRTTVR